MRKYQAPQHILEFAEDIDLINIRYSKLCAERVEEVLEPVPPVFRLAIAAAQEGDTEEDYREIRITVGVEVQTSNGGVDIDVQAFYKMPKTYEKHADTLLITEFFNHLGMSTVVPYLRSALSDLSLRVLGRDIAMPAFVPGDVVFDLPQPGDYLDFSVPGDD